MNVSLILCEKNMQISKQQTIHLLLPVTQIQSIVSHLRKWLFPLVASEGKSLTVGFLR